MKKIRVGLDIDGCIYRYADTAIYLLRTHRQENVSLDEWTSWDYLKTKVSKESWKWIWSEAIEKHGLFRYGSIYKGSREFLQAMEPFCDNVVITSRPANAIQDTIDWLAYQKLPTHEIHVIGSQPKSSVYPVCDIYIDDAIHNAVDIYNNTKAEIIIPDRPWNKGESLPDRMHRSFSWDQAEQILMLKHEEINAVAATL